MSIVRMAFFEGTVPAGQEVAFRTYVNDRLLPLWRSFPELLSFRKFTDIRTDDDAHPFVLVLEFTYASREAMEIALSSDVRQESREVTKGLFEYFQGRISHIVCDASD